MPDDATDDIMRATYCALCKHGYADTTMQAIADESAKSKATLHYHYDSKRDLLLAFLDYLLDEFTAALDDADDGAPAERLLALAETVLTPPADRPHQEFQTAILEIKAQGPYVDEFRERLEAFDRRLHDRFRAVVAEGVERGAFRADVDSDEAATFLVTVLVGAQTRRVAVGESTRSARRLLGTYVDRALLARDAELVSG